MKRLLAVAALVAVVTTTAVAATPPTQTADTLTVGVNLPSEGFQVGVVRGSDVLLAQGLEIDLSRILAFRLGLKKTVFVQSRFDRLFSAGAKPWDLAIAEITITPGRRVTSDFSVPYLKVDQAVLLSTSVPGTTPRTIAGLKGLKICALAKSTGADAATTTIRPTRPVMLVGNVPTLVLDVQTGKCDAVVYDSPTLATLKARAPLRFGTLLGVIPTGESYGIALPQGSTLRPAVNKAVTSMIDDGTVARLQRKWLATGIDKLPALR
jgi:polar amino acid transport system substrate-binding protein